MDDDLTTGKPSFLSGQLTAQRSWVYARIEPIRDRLLAVEHENRELRELVSALSIRLAELEREA